MTPALFNPHKRSLIRGNVLVLCSFLIALPMSHFPRLQPSPLLILPTLGALVGTAETIRCIRKRWSLYHGGVLFCIYMDLMALSMLLFLLLYPYLPPIATRT